jgi:hypothetical protein
MEDPCPVGGLAHWKAQLLQCADLLAAVPRGQLSIDVLLTVQKLVVPATNPHRGQLRSEPAYVWFNGVMRQELPTPTDAYKMIVATLRQLEDKMASGTVCLDPVDSAADIAFEVLRAHPFMDGNGRVARALAHWLLNQCGYRIIRDPRSYFREHDTFCYDALAIRQCLPPRSSDAGPWNAFFAGLVDYCYEGRAQVGFSIIHADATNRQRDCRSNQA